MVKRKTQKEKRQEEFDNIIAQSTELSQDDINEVIESTAVYGTATPGLPWGAVNGPPWTYYDTTGLPPPLVRQAYQHLWDDWVSPVKGKYVLYEWGHPEDAPKREEWMRIAYFPGEVPDTPENPEGWRTWSHDLEAVMYKVDDAFGRRHGESMLGPPWWIDEGMTYTEDFKFGSDEVEELNYFQQHAMNEARVSSGVAPRPIETAYINAPGIKKGEGYYIRRRDVRVRSHRRRGVR